MSEPKIFINNETFNILNGTYLTNVGDWRFKTRADRRPDIKLQDCEDMGGKRNELHFEKHGEK